MDRPARVAVGEVLVQAFRPETSLANGVPRNATNANDVLVRNANCNTASY